MLYEFDHQQIATLTTHETSDEQLMACIQARDEAALATLYRRHTALLRTVISRVVHNEHDVDDLLQEVFVELWNRAAHYDEAKGKALGWIVTLARRRAIDKVRRRQACARAEERLRLETERSPAMARQPRVEDDVYAADRAAVLQRLLATLPEAQREALRLAYYRGLSQREIAAQTGIPLGTIKTRLELAVRKVRAAILALGGAEEWSPAHA
jgi:RNA polymerase sigma-70 factor (ECF subfamily)